MPLAALLLAAAVAEWPQTRAEATGFKETSSYADVVGFLQGLQRMGAPIRVEWIGKSAEGRPIPLAVVARPLPASAQDAVRSGKPIVYVQANIHAGEVEGKEAILHLLRRYSQEKQGILDQIILLVNPIYNADGNEKLAPQARNRPGQNGPEMVGVRANGQGLDLNRDYVKAVSPEMRAALRHVWVPYRPHVMMDLHTTDGTRHGYPLTYAPPLNPNTDRGLLYFAREAFMPAVRKEMAARGWPTLDYGNVETRGGTRGWYVVGPEARYSTNYAGLVNCIGVLSEAVVYDDFERRVRSTEAFVDCVLAETVKSSGAILALAAAAAGIAAEGRTGALGTKFEVRSRGEEKVRLERAGAQPKSGPVSDVEEVAMPVFDRFVPTDSVRMPAAFLFRAEETDVADLLSRHGILVERLEEDWEGTVEQFVVAKAAQAAQPFQQVRLQTLEGELQETRLRAEKGSFVVDARQPLAVLAFHILYPSGTDGAVAWGFFGDPPEAGGPAPVWLAKSPVRAARSLHPAPAD